MVMLIGLLKIVWMSLLKFKLSVCFICDILLGENDVGVCGFNDGLIVFEMVYLMLL